MPLRKMDAQAVLLLGESSAHRAFVIKIPGMSVPEPSEDILWRDGSKCTSNTIVKCLDRVFFPAPQQRFELGEQHLYRVEIRTVR